MNEGIPNKERMQTSREDVVKSLLSDPENLSVLKEYLDVRQETVKTNADTLRLNVEIAEIYRDAGLIEAARESYEAAAGQAWYEYNDELHEQIIVELKKLTS